MRPRDLHRFVKALPFLLAVGLVMACNGTVGGGSSTGTSALPSEEEQQRQMEELLQRFPIKSYTSFEEAEQVAGYHIPRPSSEYPIADGLTHLRWYPQLERPFSETHYPYPPGAPGGFKVDVKPSYFYPDGDKTATSGKPTTAGGKAGWLDQDEYDWTFVFECGSVDDVKLWCQVGAGKSIGWEGFDHFVSTLQ